MKRTLLFFSMAVLMTVLPSTVWAGQKQSDSVAGRAYRAGEAGKFAEAAGLYEWLVQEYPPRTQDDVGVLLTAADYEALAGNKDRAFALCERALLVPAKEGAHPPAMLPGPLDLRGEARWKMAQIRRSQGRWSEALALYQLNRRTYPRDDGCVPSGYAFQEMAMVEGECLEHLGRFDEAAALYFVAALNADSSVIPEAMRRLCDLYRGANQLEDLARNMAREKDKFDKKVELEWGGGEKGSPFQERMSRLSPFIIYERVLRFRTKIRAHDWDALVETLRGTDLKQQEEFREWEVYRLNVGEAVAALLTLDDPARNEARHVLENLIKRESAPEDAHTNVNMRAVVLVLGGRDADGVTQDIEARRVEFLGRATYTNKDFAPRQPAVIPKNLKLPVVLSTELQQ